jgi:hypothetical protein
VLYRPECGERGFDSGAPDLLQVDVDRGRQWTARSEAGKIFAGEFNVFEDRDCFQGEVVIGLMRELGPANGGRAQI